MRQEVSSNPIAFALMPFTPVMNAIWITALAPTLEAAGFRASRADESLNQRAIMMDVVRGIEASDLVVAELTGRNANVFYELGLAHALRKPVLMLAQTSGDLTFDIGAYRAILYSVSFDDGVLKTDLHDQLSPVLQAVKSGRTAFGNPFDDYSSLPSAHPPDASGLLDDAIAMGEAVEPFLRTLSRLTALMEALRIAQEEVTTESAAREFPSQLHRARFTYEAFAPLWNDYAVRFEQLIVSELTPHTLVIERGSLAFLRLIELQGGSAQADAYVASTSELSRAASAYTEPFRMLGTVVTQIASVSGALQAPGQKLATALFQVAEQFERIAAVAGKLEDARRRDPTPMLAALTNTS